VVLAVERVLQEVLEEVTHITTALPVAQEQQDKVMLAAAVTTTAVVFGLAVVVAGLEPLAVMVLQVLVALAVLDCQTQLVALLCFMQVGAGVADFMLQQVLEVTAVAVQVQVGQPIPMEMLALQIQVVAVAVLLEHLVVMVAMAVQAS
jgi:hypothetical protein